MNICRWVVLVPLRPIIVHTQPVHSCPNLIRITGIGSLLLKDTLTETFEPGATVKVEEPLLRALDCKSTVPPPDDQSICTQSRDLKFDTLTTDLVGGSGEMRCFNAVDMGGKICDLVVTTLTLGYKPLFPGMNKYVGADMAKINMAVYFKTDFYFRFEADDGTDCVVDHFALSFLDFDQGQLRKVQEVVSVCGARNAFTCSTTELATSEENGCATFRSTSPGDSNNINCVSMSSKLDDPPRVYSSDQSAHSTAFSEVSSPIGHLGQSLDAHKMPKVGTQKFFKSMNLQARLL